MSAEAARLGAALRQRRISMPHPKRQEDVALEAGLSQKIISQIERGEQDLLNSGFGNVLAIIRALDWTLGQLQEAASVDLGVTDVSLVGEAAVGVYPLTSALKPAHPGKPVDHEALAPGAKQPMIFRADTDEMNGTSPASIRPGEYLHVDLADIHLKEGQVYVLAEKNSVHVRLYTTTRLGPIFRAENRTGDHEDIPAGEARVIGRVYTVTSDRAPQLN